MEASWNRLKKGITAVDARHCKKPHRWTPLGSRRKTLARRGPTVTRNDLCEGRGLAQWEQGTNRGGSRQRTRRGFKKKPRAISPTKRKGGGEIARGEPQETTRKLTEKEGGGDAQERPQHLHKDKL